MVNRKDGDVGSTEFSMEKPDRKSERPSDAEVKVLSDSFESLQPQEVLASTLERFSPKIILACSFGAEDMVLLDMIHRINPKTPLFVLDTDFLFPETYSLIDKVVEKYQLTSKQLIRVQSLLTPQEQSRQYGEALWSRDPNQCCELRKVEPLRRVLQPYEAWITGIRRDQTPTRANAGIVEWDTRFELVKINPLANWSTQDVWTYIRIYEVPYNELHDQNYPSIGCTHCTSPVDPGNDPRAGRWKNNVKTECGLHTGRVKEEQNKV